MNILGESYLIAKLKGGEDVSLISQGKRIVHTEK